MCRLRVRRMSQRFPSRSGLDSTDARAAARAMLAMNVTEFLKQFRR